MEKRFLGVTVSACTMHAFLDSHWLFDSGEEYTLNEINPQGAGDYPLEAPVPDDRMQQEIDAIHVYVAQAMRALDDVLKPLHDSASPEALTKSLDHAEAGLSNYQPQTHGSDELLNLSHARVDAYRLAKLAQRLRSLYLEAASRNEQPR